MTEKNAHTNETQKRQQQLWCGSSSLVLFKLSYSIILVVSLSLKHLKFPTSETVFGCFSLNFKQVTVVRDAIEFKAKYPLYEAVNRCARGQGWSPESLFFYFLFFYNLYFSSPEFFSRPFQLFPAPTNCPWVSEADIFIDYFYLVCLRFHYNQLEEGKFSLPIILETRRSPSTHL